MNKLKEIIFRKGFKITVLDESKDNCVIKFDIALKVKEENKKYTYLIEEIPSMIKGINKVDLNFEELIAKINYDESLISLEKILKILDVAKELIIEEWDYIKKNGEDNTEEVLVVLKKKFKIQISKI